jgi:hypothetical protein
MDTAASRITTLKKPDCAGVIISNGKKTPDGGLRELRSHLSYVPDYFDQISVHIRGHSPAKLFRDASQYEQTTP